MTDGLSPGDRRTLILGAAIIGSMIILAVGVPRYGAWRASAFGDAEREAASLARLEASVARFNRTARSLSTAQGEMVTLDSLLLPGTSLSAAGTALAAAISEAAEGAEAQLGSIQVRRDSTSRAELTRIGARASVIGDVESLALFLESLEASPPVLAVREWSISGGSPGVAPTQRVSLRMEVLVEGLARVADQRSEP